MTNHHISSMLSLYFISGSQDCHHLPNSPAENLLFILEQALAAGITCFQFRDKGPRSLKHLPNQQFKLAQQCQDLCQQYQVPFIIDDDIELALTLKADGIHVGQTDFPAHKIKQLFPYPIIVGLSVHSLAQAQSQHIHHNQIDYLGVGPIFPTQSKENPDPCVGTTLIKKIRQQGIQQPIVAIGGINENNIQSVRNQGENGIAVISAITQSPNIQKTVHALLPIS